MAAQAKESLPPNIISLVPRSSALFPEKGLKKCYLGQKSCFLLPDKIMILAGLNPGSQED